MKCTGIYFLIKSHKTHLISIISPAAELHLAALVIEGEPSDVDFACALEDAGWYV